MRRASRSPVFALPGAGVASAGLPERCVGDAHRMPARLESLLRITDCSNPLGPLIWFQGALVLAGLQASVILRSRARGTDRPAQEVIRPVPLVPMGERIAVKPGVPLRGNPGPNRLALRLVDQEGRTLAEEQDLGECTDGMRGIQIPFDLGVSALVWVAARAWTEHGPRIGVSGEVVFPWGVNLRIGFRPSGSNGNGKSGRTAEVHVIRPGMAWYSREKTLESSSPDNSWVSIRFAEAGGRPVGVEHVVGHCVLV